MKSILVLAAMASFATGQVTAADVPPVIQSATVGGLRWYFHWHKTPPETTRINCRAHRFGEDYIVFCDPGNVTLDLSPSEAGRLQMNVIREPYADAATELLLFAMHEEKPETASYLIPVRMEEIKRYDINLAVSKRLMEETRSYMQSLMRLYERSGQHVRSLFPLVSATDPFYEACLLKGEKVEVIEQFPIAGGNALFSPHWSYDIPHRNMPSNAQSNVGDASRWYRSLPEPVAK